VNYTLDGKTPSRIQRSTRVRAAVRQLDAEGKQPTSRNVLARMAGHDDVKKFPQGMGGTDLLVFRDAMRDNGYAQVNSMWKKQVASDGLDEVLCDCPHSKYEGHEMTEHEATVRGAMVGVSFAVIDLQPYQEEMYVKLVRGRGKFVLVP
jgi:hypothetical protein